MQNLKWILVLVLLLNCGGINYVFSSEVHQSKLNTEAGTQISVDIQELSPSRISTSISFFQERVFPGSHKILSEENCREYSSDKAYFSKSLLIEPGLSPPDIIFPFHTFL